MAWKIFMVKQVEQALWELPDGQTVDFKNLPIGAMYEEVIEPRSSRLSLHYKENVASTRKPLVVKIPTNPYDNTWDGDTGGLLFWIDQGFADGTGWQVSGEAPNLTLSPSVNFMGGSHAQGSYHGWIQNGVISDDCEGRTYPQFPNTA